jgi:PAS domain S-box-containing protein
MKELRARRGGRTDQAKRKHAEVNRSRESYRELFEMVKDAVFVSNVEGQLIDVNPSWLELFGYRSKREVLKLDLATDIYVNPKDRTRLLKLLKKEKFVTDYEIAAKRRDGTRVIVSISDQVIQDGKGKAIGYVGMVRDITKRKEYERQLEEYNVRLEKEVQDRTKKLKESEEKYRRLFEVSKDPLYMTTKKGNLIDLNQATVELFGYGSKEDLMKIGSTTKLYVNSEDRRKMQKRMEEKGFVKDMEQELKRKDGTKIHALVTGNTRRDDKGNVIGYQVMVKDITERKLAEEALKGSEERYRTLLNNANDAVFVYQRTAEGMPGKFIEVNDVACQRLGYTREELLMLSPLDIAVPEKVSDFSALMEKFLADKHVVWEWVNVAKDGRKIPVEISTHLFDLNGQPTVLSITRDITERKHAEEKLKEYSERLEEMVEQRTKELREAQEQLVHQEKLAVMGELAGGVGHELRNPLGAIKNAAYFLNMVLEEPEPKVRESLEILQKEVATSERIIGSLLDFARPKAPIRRKVEINEVLREALSRSTVPEDIEVVTQHDGGKAAILADSDQLVQTFGNIILNAIQAMPYGGQLTIKSETVSLDSIAISFSDTGVGIPEETLERLFEPLFTTKAKGIGLGLAIVKTQVEAHGGTIEAQSEVEKGSTFTVRLPMEGGEGKEHGG